jgi:hypothetical protein
MHNVYLHTENTEKISGKQVAQLFGALLEKYGRVVSNLLLVNVL